MCQGIFVDICTSQDFFAVMSQFGDLKTFKTYSFIIVYILYYHWPIYQSV